MIRVDGGSDQRRDLLKTVRIFRAPKEDEGYLLDRWAIRSFSRDPTQATVLASTRWSWLLQQDNKHTLQTDTLAKTGCWPYSWSTTPLGHKGDDVRVGNDVVASRNRVLVILFLLLGLLYIIYSFVNTPGYKRRVILYSQPKFRTNILPPPSGSMCITG
jgi:hypothetical protein